MNNSYKKYLQRAYRRSTKKRWPRFYEPLAHDLLIQVCITFKELIGHIRYFELSSTNAVSVAIKIPEYYSIEAQQLHEFFEPGYECYKEVDDDNLSWGSHVVIWHQPEIKNITDKYGEPDSFAVGYTQEDLGGNLIILELS